MKIERYKPKPKPRTKPFRPSPDFDFDFTPIFEKDIDLYLDYLDSEYGGLSSKEKRETIKDILRQLSAVADHVEDKYKKELRLKEPAQLKKWQKEVIRKETHNKRKEGLKKIFLLDAYARRNPVKDLLATDRIYFDPDYKRIQRKLNISKRQCQKYLRELSIRGIYKSWGKQGSRQIMRYQIGKLYWYETKDGKTDKGPRYYLTEEKWKKSRA